MDPVAWQVLRLTLAGVFVLALWHKLADPVRFSATVADYQLVPRPLAWPVALAIIAAECAVVAMLAFSIDVPRAAALAGLLLAIYLGAITINLARGRTAIDCGCLGPAGRGQHRLSWWLAPRNVLLIAMGAALVAIAPLERALGWLDYTTVGCATTALLVLYFGADQLIANEARQREFAP